MRHWRAAVIRREWKKGGWDLNLKDPKDINEKMQWLLCYYDTSSWSRYADKLAVREYLKEKGYADLVVPVLAVWKSAEEMDLSPLPDKFVLKCNHDSGSSLIVDKRDGIDEAAIKARFKRLLKRRFGYVNGELYYNDIPRRIFAEPFLESPEGQSSIPDYKVWCFDGKAYCIWACINRSHDKVTVRTYDLDWKAIEGADERTDHYIPAKDELPRPRNMGRMLEAAAALSKGFPEVRVDFYEVGGKLYFSEMTFAAMGGNIRFHTPSFLLELGAQCKLDIER